MSMDKKIFTPKGNGPWRAVLFFQDGVGLREGLYAMGERLSGEGFFVVMPNLFWRYGNYQPFDPKSVFADQGPERQRLMSMVRGLDPAAMMEDVKACLDFLDGEPRAKKGAVGCTGYCLGGGAAFRAAGTFPDRIGAAASFHGARLVTDAPDSPHLLAPKIRARLYFGVAEIDQAHTPEISRRLDEALTAANVPHEIETFAKVAHGFCVPDLPVYDRGAAERAWSKLTGLLEQLD
jgi:carboxymethylenebutenolidase